MQKTDQIGPLTVSELLSVLSDKIGKDFEQMLISNDFCPACGKELTQAKNPPEIVCSSCGVVYGSGKMSERIPFEMETYTPTNELGAGHGLGGTLKESDSWVVLTHGPLGNIDMPIRSKQIRVLVSTVEHPKILNFLKLGRLRTHEWGFTDHKSNESVVFSNHFGKMLRKVGGYFIISKLRVPAQEIVDACFALSMLQLKGQKKWEEVMTKLNVSDFIYKDIVEIDAALRCSHGRSPGT